MPLSGSRFLDSFRQYPPSGTSPEATGVNVRATRMPAQPHRAWTHLANGVDSIEFSGRQNPEPFALSSEVLQTPLKTLSLQFPAHLITRPESLGRTGSLVYPEIIAAINTLPPVFQHTLYQLMLQNRFTLSPISQPDLLKRRYRANYNNPKHLAAQLQRSISPAQKAGILLHSLKFDYFFQDPELIENFGRVARKSGDPQMIEAFEVLKQRTTPQNNGPSVFKPALSSWPSVSPKLREELLRAFDDTPTNTSATPPVDEQPTQPLSMGPEPHFITAQQKRDKAWLEQQLLQYYLTEVLNKEHFDRLLTILQIIKEVRSGKRPPIHKQQLPEYTSLPIPQQDSSLKATLLMPVYDSVTVYPMREEDTGRLWWKGTKWVEDRDAEPLITLSADEVSNLDTGDSGLRIYEDELFQLIRSAPMRQMLAQPIKENIISAFKEAGVRVPTALRQFLSQVDQFRSFPVLDKKAKDRDILKALQDYFTPSDAPPVLLHQVNWDSLLPDITLRRLLLHTLINSVPSEDATDSPPRYYPMAGVAYFPSHCDTYSSPLYDKKSYNSLLQQPEYIHTVALHMMAQAIDQELGGLLHQGRPFSEDPEFMKTFIPELQHWIEYKLTYSSSTFDNPTHLARAYLPTGTKHLVVGDILQTDTDWLTRIENWLQLTEENPPEDPSQQEALNETIAKMGRLRESWSFLTSALWNPHPDSAKNYVEKHFPKTVQVIHTQLDEATQTLLEKPSLIQTPMKKSKRG